MTADGSETSCTRIQFGLSSLLVFITGLAFLLSSIHQDELGLWMAYALVIVVAVRKHASPSQLAGLIAIGIGIWLFLRPTIQGNPQPTRTEACRNNLRQVALALHQYQSDYGVFPPASVTDAGGKPMHSWRVLLLPYVDEPFLYRKYDFSEPWNGPHNRRLQQTRACYFCPSDRAKRKSDTSYVAIVGADSGRFLMPASKREGARGALDPLMLIEVGQSGIHWMEPKDLTIDEVLDDLRTGKGQKYATHRGRIHVLYGDIRVELLDTASLLQTLQALAAQRAGNRDERSTGRIHPSRPP